jgi:hypothetical protein
MNQNASFVLPIFLAACATVPPISIPTVHHVGVMREVMREGRTEARATLADFRAVGTIGVGAMTGLHGEITIDDGVAWVAIDDAEVAVAAPTTTATLLTTGRVPAWRDVELETIDDLAMLAAAIEREYGERIPDGVCIPFTIDGRGSVQIHVARGGCPHDPSLPPQRAPMRWSADDVDVRLVGVFVRGREGAMTHHGTSLHVHAFATEAVGRRRMGHVDSVRLATGARLRLGQAAESLVDSRSVIE